MYPHYFSLCCYCCARPLLVLKTQARRADGYQVKVTMENIEDVSIS